MCKAAWKSGDYRSLTFSSWRFTVFGKMDGIGSDSLSDFGHENKP
jgi:hypothetical protein